MRAIFVLAAVLALLSPAAAFAHGGMVHAEGEHATKAFIEQSWSPVCPPGSGHVCGCGNLSLCDGTGQPVLAARSVVTIPARVVAAVLLLPAQTQPSPQFSPALPRAPPFFA